MSDADRELLAERSATVRPARAAGFRTLLVHAYGRLDLRRVHTIARAGPDDLRAFLAVLRDRTG